ncbi:MAG: ABC transporter permease [Immundisolibacterales bacterium]|nr:ABC transporter permease [Immundisolibacterales bacterium]
MRRFLAIRFLQALVALLAITLIVFGLTHLTGSPVDALLPDDASQAQIESLIRHWGLDRPLHEQYLAFLGNALQGDLGVSLKWRGYTAMEVVLQRLPATLKLGGLSVLLSIVVAIPLGVVAARHRGTMVDKSANVVALLGQSLPQFWLGIMLIWIFAVGLGWFPTSGQGGLPHMILPAIAMASFQVAALARLTRSAMLDSLRSEYVKLARLKGVPEYRIVWKHALRNAAIVPLTYFGLLAGSLLTGSVVIESVFSWPGTGLLSIEAIRGRDYPVVQAVVILFAVVFLLINYVVDALYALVDPRIRRA